MLVAGDARSSRVRGLDPDGVLALAGELARAAEDAATVALRIRRALREGGTTSVAPGRLEAAGRWATEQAADLRRRLRTITDRREATVARLTVDLGSMFRSDLVCEADAAHTARLFAAVHPDDLRWLGATYAARLAHLPGAPAEVRYEANRTLIRADLPAAEAAVARARQAVEVATSTTPWSPQEAVALLIAERTARRQLAEAERRRDALLAWSQPDRQILGYRADGGGRLIEVVGDLDTAEHVAFTLPGVSNTLLTYEAQHRPNTQALADATAGTDTAIVSFLYDAPDWLGPGAGSGPARRGADELAALARDLHELVREDAHVTVVAHSYGSTTTGHALTGTDLARFVDDVVLLGSPGTGVDSRADLPAEVRVWVAATDDDPVPWLPFHDRDPSHPAFGATVIDTGDASGHSQYYTAPVSLENIARIVTGRFDEVDVVPHREPDPTPSGGGY